MQPLFRDFLPEAHTGSLDKEAPDAWMISSFPQHWHGGLEDSVMQGYSSPFGLCYLLLNTHLTPRPLHIISSI